MFWSASDLDHGDEVEIPSILRPWVDLLSADESLAVHRADHPSHIASVALAGEVGTTIGEWVRTAAVAHILSWRISDYLAVERQPRDLVLVGGKDATLWVTERFTKTYVRDWRMASLQWEQLFNSHPLEAARAAGVPVALLKERIVTAEMIDDALRINLVHRRGEDFEQRELGDSSIAALVTLLDSGQHRTALEMARRFHEAWPHEPHFAMAYAFCLIVIDANRARATLESLPLGAVDGATTIRDANLATCALITGDVHGAREHLPTLAQSRSEMAWLWDPISVVNAEPHVRYFSVGEWIDQFTIAESRVDSAN